MNLLIFLEHSRATPTFRSAVNEFLRTGRANSAIAFNLSSPPVKVERTLTKILEEYPELPIARIEIEGASGCEYFRGTATIHAGEEERCVRFHWDCRWKAEQLGWTDYFGFPDQIRAARECGYDCFRTWSEEEVAYSS